VILVGIDDTDMPDTPGTNHLARALVACVAGRYECVRIVRHQLVDDPRIPRTSKNGSASVLLQPTTCEPVASLIAELRSGMNASFVPGSDSGLCVADCDPDLLPLAVTEFGRVCQREIVDQSEAHRLADSLGLHLEGLGGTGGGVIGALAAVGLLACGDDGRVVQMGLWPDELSGVHDVETLRTRGVEVRRLDSGVVIREGLVDVSERLRPNVRGGGVVLFVTEHGERPRCWQAVRLP
jgi:hypothetical protein